MKRIAMYAAAAALLISPWVAQSVQPAPSNDSVVAKCVDPKGGIAPVAYSTPLLTSTRATGITVLACGGGGGGGGGGGVGGCKPGSGSCGPR